VVSEVVTNAIVHGDPGGVIEVRASRAADALRIEVTDRGPGLASSPRSTTSAPEGGFGLFLVEQLSRRWGLVRHSATTRVWFEFEAA
jgi:anti-sigma regulatory factor (Ser/Thr protein kinase)